MSTSSNQSGEVFKGKGGIQLEKLKKLKCTYDKANWSIRALRHGFLYQLDNLIRNWKGRYPNLRCIFRNEEMNYFLEDYFTDFCCGANDFAQGKRFINFLIRSKYKYEPGVDNKGVKVLHLALEKGYKDWIEWLLRFGADPNGVNKDGETAIHVIIHKANTLYNETFLKKFFEIIDDEQLTLQIDAKDNLGRTALQWAVATIRPQVVDMLLDRGAHDLSNFVFPASSYFGQNFIDFLDLMCPPIFENWGRPALVFNILAVVQHLETRGYELDSSDAMTIMTFFFDHGLCNSVTGEKYWYDKEEFDSKAKDLMINPDLSVHDLVQLRPKQAAKLLKFEDYKRFVFSEKFRKLPKGSITAYISNLPRIISRQFFLPWALESFLKLIHHRLPILCCDMILDNLGNEDLYKICSAAASKSS